MCHQVANWCNARLIVIGRRPAVLQFSRKARAKPASIFRPDMLVGEGQDLFSERVERWNSGSSQKRSGLSKKKYVFQVQKMMVAIISETFRDNLNRCVSY